MAEWSQTKRDLINAFAMIIRTSPLAGNVDQQPLLMAFDQILSRQTDKTNIDLAPLNEYLVVQAKADPDNVTAALLFFQSRQDRWHVQLKLPPHISTLPPAQREKFIEEFSSRGASSGTYAGRDASQNLRGQKEEAPPAPKEAEPKKTQQTPYPKPTGGTPKGLMVVLGIAAVILVISLILNANADESLLEQPLAGWVVERGALHCQEPPRVRKPYAFCTISEAAFEKLSKPEFDAMASVTKESFEKLGFTKLLVELKESGRIVASL